MSSSHQKGPSKEVQPPTSKEIDIFKQYDRNKTGSIEVDELKELMADLGLLTGRTPSDVTACVVASFAAADADRDGRLNLPEFTAYYRRASAPRVIDLLKNDHADLLDGLRGAFSSWASFGVRSNKPSGELKMGSAHWLKLCRDTGIVGTRSALSSTDADLIFAKVKDRGQQRISFLQFVDALGLVAPRRGQTITALIQEILDSAGPVLNGTTVTAPQFYGTSRMNAEGSGQRRKSSLGPDEVRPMKSACSSPTSSSQASQPSSRTPSSTSTSQQRRRTSSASLPKKVSGEVREVAVSTPRSPSSITIPAHHAVTAFEKAECSISPELETSVSNAEQVLRVFAAFAGFGAGTSPVAPSASAGQSHSVSPLKMEIDSKQFAKLSKDAGLATSAADAVAVDLCFAKARARGARRLGFGDFLVALALLAKEKGVEEREVLEVIAECPGPSRRNSTTPQYARLHDDKTTFCGVYKRGGPVTVDGSAPDLAKLLSRDAPSRLSMG